MNTDENRYSVSISKYSTTISKILKYAKINISNNTAEYLYITTGYTGCTRKTGTPEYFENR